MKGKYSTLEKISLVLLSLGVVTLFSTTLLFIRKTSNINFHSPIDTGIWSNYGSFISGFVGSIFSIATIILIYITYKAQKEELEQTREELVETRKITEAQGKTMSRQQFENTLFKLFDNHLKNIKSHEGNLPIKDMLLRDADSLMHQTQVYHQYIENRLVNQLFYFSYNPIKNLIIQSELTNRINEDIIHIGEFILDQVSLSELETEFYFRALFNILFDAEKYIFGYCTLLRVSGCESDVSIGINKFNKHFQGIPQVFKLLETDIVQFYPTIKFALSKVDSNKKTLNFTDLKGSAIFYLENNSDDKIEILAVIINEEYDLLDRKIVLETNHCFEFGYLYEFINEKYFKNDLDKQLQEKTLKQTLMLNRIKLNEDRVLSLNIKLINKTGKEFEYKCHFQISFIEDEVPALDLYLSS